MKSLKQEFTKGFWSQNPVLVLLLGLCPTLAVTTNAFNGLGMGLATTFVLLGSNVVVSSVRSAIPKQVRIPCFIVVIATFVTLVDMLTAAYFPGLHEALGIFIPLIVVNCMVLGRAEAFASSNSMGRSIIDAVGMGLGFAVTLAALGGVREFLAAGTLFDIKLIPAWEQPFLMMKFAPGAFIVLGFFVGGMNYVAKRQAMKEGRVFLPKTLKCACCSLCNLKQKHEG